MSFINIGIVAHVDAGKTTITENLLYSSGRIKDKGSVDKGTAITDSLIIEQDRGISIKASSVSLVWKQKTINIIDTPGHIDFSSEVERSFKAIDAAILIISAVEGVQAHTENLWEALQELKIPTLIFINKIDRIGANTIAVVNEIRNALSNDVIALHSVSAEETDIPQLDNVIFNNLIQNKSSDLEDEFIEKIAENSEILLNKYVHGETIGIALLNAEFKKMIAGCVLTPILFGSAKFKLGITELLDTVVTFFPESGAGDEKTKGIVYKVIHDPTAGKMAGVRLFSGKINIRDSLFNCSTGEESKVTLIKKKYVRKLENIDSFSAGDIAYIAGFKNLKPGDLIGSSMFRAASKKHFLNLF